MIDCENEIYDKVSRKIEEMFPKAILSSEYLTSPPKFPYISIVEIGNAVVENTQSSTQIENHALLTYEINVYSNKTSGRKSECKRIMAEIDKQMGSLGFTRTMIAPIPNMNDTTIYRLTARYQAIVSQNKVIYRR